MLNAANLVVFLVMATTVFGTLVSLNRHPHWFIRCWDFPRVQIIGVAWSTTIVFLAINLVAGQPIGRSGEWLIITAVLVSVWHSFLIVPYTLLAPQQAKSFDSTANRSADQSADLEIGRLTIAVSNVEQENDSFDQWRQAIMEADADVVIVAEVDQRWKSVLETLATKYPYQVIYPQDNWYGIAMLSRLKIDKHTIRFLVQDDVPSIDAMLRMRNDRLVRVIAVHPRPPEPIRDNDATARDAELALWGIELADENGPVVIGGDLNDVAWSHSTRLFLRMSRLLDPRRGRGLFNSFHADHWWMRFPLDHLFHSNHFTVRDLRKMPHVGSDHFPILIDLQLESNRRHEHEPLEQQSDDRMEAMVHIQLADAEPNMTPRLIQNDDPLHLRQRHS